MIEETAFLIYNSGRGPLVLFLSTTLPAAKYDARNCACIARIPLI
jgi:hypothetical protein